MGFLFRHRTKRLAENFRELQFYLNTETEENIGRGMSPVDARAAAQRKLGNQTLLREEVYNMNGIAFLESAWNDISYSLRTMRRNPVFTLTAIITLTIGIGANTAIFTVFQAVLLRPLTIALRIDSSISRRTIHEKANSTGSFS